MDKFKGLTTGTKALVIASGIVCVSVGAYSIYRIISKTRAPSIKRLPSENVDESSENKIISSSGAKVLVLGLEKSGKSCLLAAFSNEEVVKEYQPTLGFNVVCITNIDKRLDIMEIGGSGKFKECWGNFVKDVHILIYVIDSCDRNRLLESFDTLCEMLQMEELSNVPVIVIFSKRDSKHALPLNEMMVYLEDDRFGNWNIEYRSTMVKCGGAPTTDGVVELEEVLTSLL